MKTVYSLIASLVIGCSVQAQSKGSESIDSLILKLRSAKFTTRVQSSEALMTLPESEAALRLALPTSDLETCRRIEEILRHHDRRPLRELSEHMRVGNMDEIIKRVADWPEGKYEDELWSMTSNLVNKLYELHLKKKGETEIPNFPSGLTDKNPPAVVKADLVTEATKGDPELDKMNFVRARECMFGFKGPFNNEFQRYGFVVASDTASFSSETPHFVFAGKGVTIKCGVRGAIVICGGDVVIYGPVTGSLITTTRNKAKNWPTGTALDS